MGFDHKNQVPLGLLTPSQSLSPSCAGAGASSIGDGRRRVNLVRRRVNLVPRKSRVNLVPRKSAEKQKDSTVATPSQSRPTRGKAEGFDKLFASPTRAPKVGRLHLTGYAATIICSS